MPIDNDQECLICYSPMTNEASIKFECCGHSFCRDCSKEWLIRSSTCPLDREPVKKLRYKAGTEQTIITILDFYFMSNLENSKSRFNISLSTFVEMKKFTQKLRANWIHVQNVASIFQPIKEIEFCNSFQSFQKNYHVVFESFNEILKCEEFSHKYICDHKDNHLDKFIFQVNKIKRLCRLINCIIKLSNVILKHFLNKSINWIDFIKYLSELSNQSANLINAYIIHVESMEMTLKLFVSRICNQLTHVEYLFPLLSNYKLETMRIFSDIESQSIKSDQSQISKVKTYKISHDKNSQIACKLVTDILISMKEILGIINLHSDKFQRNKIRLKLECHLCAIFEIEERFWIEYSEEILKKNYKNDFGGNIIKDLYKFFIEFTEYYYHIKWKEAEKVLEVIDFLKIKLEVIFEKLQTRFSNENFSELIENLMSTIYSAI